MRAKVRFFRQHSLETCGISCILMALHAFGRVRYPTAKQEMKLYGIYRCRAFRGTLAPAVALCLSKNGLEVTVRQSSPRGMDNRDGYYPEPLYRELQREYTGTLEKLGDRARVEEDPCFSPEWFRAQLDLGRLPIVQCVVPGNADGMHEETLHWVLLYGYEDGCFLACDPLSHKICLTEAELERYTDTPVGRISVSVGRGKERAENGGGQCAPPPGPEQK